MVGMLNFYFMENKYFPSKDKETTKQGTRCSLNYTNLKNNKTETNENKTE